MVGQLHPHGPLRIEQLQKASNGAVNITWLVYRPGYETRQAEDGQPHIANIESVRDKYKIRLVWFSSTEELIQYVNAGQNRSSVKVSGFEYFGHSNKFCFVFDYSNHILGASQAFLHQSDLKRLSRKAFARGAYCKSWGCHSGESFSAEWKRVTGVKMIGAIGKTDYSKTYEGPCPSFLGRTLDELIFPQQTGEIRRFRGLLSLPRNLPESPVRCSSTNSPSSTPFPSSI